jgi:hypothetical protein
VSALGQRRAGHETRYFIKFDSLATDALPFIRRTFPEVPWIFLYRDPEEVLASQLSDPGAAMSPGIIRGPAVLQQSLNDTLAMSVEEHAARIIGTLCRCACLAAGRGGLFVNYTQLPEAVWNGIATHFGIHFSAAEIEIMRNITAFHAKHPRAKFVPDGELKRLGISAPAREAAARWIQPHFEELENLRLSSVPSRSSA